MFLLGFACYQLYLKGQIGHFETNKAIMVEFRWVCFKVLEVLERRGVITGRDWGSDGDIPRGGRAGSSVHVDIHGSSTRGCSCVAPAMNQN
jgi:hypothetical protein